MEKRGFIFDLMDQLENNANIHRVIVEKIEKKVGRNIVVYHANMGHPASLMLDHDVEIFENILSTLERSRHQNKLDLLVHSPGGLPEVAAKFVRVARSYSSSFRVVVPSTAMSAATLMAMGADQIVMSDTSKLGPIDPQMPTIDRTGRQFLRPAKSFIDAFSALINSAHEAIGKKQPAQAYLALLNNQDPSWIMECVRAQQATKKLAAELLKANMLKNKSDQEIEAVVGKFVAVGEEGTHGSPIFWDGAQAFGLDIHYEDKEGEVWKGVRELFVRLDRYVNNKGQAKYFVCRTGGIDLNVQVVTR
ncbi:MAG: hypothetical protein HY694_10020 [Deltaproteobacteria bacterium]|nr:hypothetical protein [Deltaproteobacteria bacterium]